MHLLEHPHFRIDLAQRRILDGRQVRLDAVEDRRAARRVLAEETQYLVAADRAEDLRRRERVVLQCSLFRRGELLAAPSFGQILILAGPLGLVSSLVGDGLQGLHELVAGLLGFVGGVDQVVPQRGGESDRGFRGHLGVETAEVRLDARVLTQPVDDVLDFIENRGRLLIGRRVFFRRLHFVLHQRLHEHRPPEGVVLSLFATHRNRPHRQ
mmetsp:Transcript_13238/g.32317  ORF Transcript_13238/g.32317 Transcript_13238/m.32317 type:complete len:211 (-) Transcript_13238:1287-1919(-)